MKISRIYDTLIMYYILLNQGKNPAVVTIYATIFNLLNKLKYIFFIVIIKKLNM